MNSSRRDFIRTVVLATGAVFTGFNQKATARTTPMVRAGSLDFKRAHEWLRSTANVSYAEDLRAADVVIVGAGPSGLAAAWKLQKQGKKVIVLDNESAVGGTMRGASWNTIAYPVGSTYFVRYNGEYKQFYDDCGIAPIETGEDALYTKNGPIVDWWNPRTIASLPYPQTDIDAFRKFRDVLLAMESIPRYPLSRARPEDISKFDLISAKEFLAGFNSPRLSRTLDLYCRSVLGAPLDKVNAYALINFYAFEFGESFNIACYTMPGGLGAIATAAAKKIGDANIISGALAMAVENEHSGGVSVSYRTADGGAHRLKARAAIVATQKNIAASIVRELPADRVKAMRSVQYAPYITVTFCCNEQLFPGRAFDFWFDDARDRFTDIIDVTSSQDAAPNAPAHTKNFVYMLSSARPVEDRALLEKEEYLVQFAQDMAAALESHVPGSLAKIEEMHVFAWGHSIVIPHVGSHTTLYPAIAKPIGNIFFANADSDLAPSIENALGSAFEAVDGVAAAVK